MTIKKILNGKKRYLELLLLADEQESMIDRYLDRGEMYVLLEEMTASKKNRRRCASSPMRAAASWSLKIWPSRRTLAARNRPEDDYVSGGDVPGNVDMLQVGTGDVPYHGGFCEACGFERSHVVKDFFTDNYERPLSRTGCGSGIWFI